MGLAEEHVKLTNGIASGKYDKSKVKQEIARIEKEYGESAFNSYIVKKKSAPWNEEDLENLEVQSAAGACSKDFYLYMADVSDYLNKSYNVKGIKGLFVEIKQFILKNWLTLLAIIAIVCAAVWFITWIYNAIQK